MLELFLRSGDRVLTREIILDRLWDVEEAPSENTVTAHIKDLRRRLKQAGANADLIETVYGVGYRLKPLTTATVDNTAPEKTKKILRHQTQTALAAVWQKFEGMHNERIAILEQANQVWQTHALSGQLLKQAQRAAHKLAGSLGLFGFPEGSRLALKMEELLEIQSEKDLASQFSQLLTALKESLQTDRRSQETTAKQHRPVILAVDNQSELAQQIMAQMAAVGIKFKLVSDPLSIDLAIAQTEFSAIIWTFSLADCTTKTFRDFAEIVNDKLALPVILFTDNSDSEQSAKNCSFRSSRIATARHARK